MIFYMKSDITCIEISCHGSIIRGTEIFLLYISNFLWTNAIFFFQASGSGTADLRHFVFYAFAGRTGIRRWDRKSEVSSFDPHIHSFLRRLIEYKTSHWKENIDYVTLLKPLKCICVFYPCIFFHYCIM